MSINPKQVTFKVEFPKIPSSVSVIETRVPDQESRRWPIQCLSRRLKLGELRSVETPHGYALGNENGEIEYFEASGAIWARDARTDEAFESEERNWNGLEEIRDTQGERRFILDAIQQKHLVEEARTLLGEAGLIREEMRFDSIALDQVAQLNEKGEEMFRGAGDATIRFSYQLDDIPFIGAGAKSQVFATSLEGRTKITGAFHAWREIIDTQDIGGIAAEEALFERIGQDGELNSYVAKGYQIEINQFEFGYLALPAFIKQRYIYPSFQIEGTVRNERNPEDYFHFGRYLQAADHKQYRKAGLFADYLYRTEI